MATKIKNPELVKIKKCKKTNCSHITIYGSESDLVKDLNERITVEKIKIPKKLNHKDSESTVIYKKNIQLVEYLFHVRKRICEMTYKWLKLKISQRHKNNSLKTHSIQTYLKNLDFYSHTELRNEYFSAF